MFASFNDAFKRKPLREQKVPDIMADFLSESLPEGVKYISDDEGNLSLHSSNGKAINISGFHVKLTEDMKRIMGEAISPAMIAQYAYNTQQKIELFADEVGKIKINGKKLSIETLNFNPNDPIQFTDSQWFMVPPAFPAPFQINVGSETYNRVLLTRRVPFASMTEMHFETDNEDPLRVKLVYDPEKNINRITVNFDLKKAKRIQDIVETVFIYNAFCDGKGRFMGKPIGNAFSGNEVERYDQESAMFWEKALCLENELGFEFDPRKENIDYEAICIVEQLYQNIIKGNPIKERSIISSITSEADDMQETLIESIGKGIYFQYIATRKVELFDKVFTLPTVLGIFNSCVESIETSDKKTVVNLSSEFEGKKAYTVSLCFKDEDKMKQFLNENNNGCQKVLEDAKDVREYMEVER